MSKKRKISFKVRQRKKKKHGCFGKSKIFRTEEELLKNKRKKKLKVNTKKEEQTKGLLNRLKKLFRRKDNELNR